ncbi:MAG: trigger factor [Prevotellaceae bacterium]|jgi:trigger factor|nr:trigger factor [Prevotellaceae bacterium]
MDVIVQNIDEFVALLKVQIAKADYEENVKKALSAHRRKAEVKGFRPGMAPMSLIQKIYGRSVLVEEINKLISESIGKYIEDEKLDIIGEPIPCDDEQKPIDWDNQSDFEFVYEIGYPPKYELKIDKTIHVPFYNITVSEDDKTKQVDYIRQRHGNLEPSEIVNEDDLVKVDLNQDGENAIKIEDTFIPMRTLETPEQKSHLLNLKVGDTIAIDINDIYTKDDDKVILLKIKKEELETINPKFNITIKEIKTNKKADINQELFDAAYGKDNVKSEEEFLQRITDEITKVYEENSNYKFSTDVRKELITKAELKFPEAFLKKWLLLVNENKLTTEQIDKEFEFFIKDLSWQTICNNIAKENDLKVEDDDMKAEAIKMARNQLMQYGLSNLPDEQLEGFAQRILGDKRQLRGIAEKVIENKVFAYLKTAVQLDEKTVKIDDFEKLYTESVL